MAISKITGSALGKDVIMKDVATADGSSPTLTLQTGDTDIAADDVLGTINFQAPDEGAGTDAILVAAGISAVSEGDFSSSSNATKLVFKTGASEAATEKMSIASTGATTITTADNNAVLTLKSTDADASLGPLLTLHRDSSSPADGDAMGRIYFSGENDADEEIQYVRFQTILSDASDGTEDSAFRLQTYVGGAVKSRVLHDPTETVFNDDSADVDFRVESDGDANCLTVDAGLDAVLMGTSTEYSGTPAKLTVNEAIDVGTTSSTGGSTISFVRAGSTGVIGGVYGKWAGYGNGGYMKFNADNVGGGSQTASIVFGTNINNSQADRFNIAGNGDLTATDTSISSISDERLKENIADFTYDMAKFKQLKARSYKWKNPIYHGNNVDTDGKALTSYGTIAQEVAAIDADYVRDYEIKDEVNADKDLLGSDNIAKTTTLTGKEHAMYISIIQQLISKVETLETKVKALEEA